MAVSVMQVWLNVAFLPMGRAREIATVAESCGVHGVAISDHVCVPTEIRSRYPASRDGVAHIPAGTPFPDPLVTIGALGSATSSLRFTTNVLLVPLRHPVLLANAVATASVFCGGRLDLGVGVGWMQEEFDALGVPFGARGEIMDEALPVLSRLWSGIPVEHRGKHFEFGPISVNPVPARPVRILVGGDSRAALRRAARLGDGWVGVNTTAAQLQSTIEVLEAERRAAGRSDEPFEIRTAMHGQVTQEQVRDFARLGVAALLVSPWQLTGNRGSIYEVPVDELLARLPGLVDLVTNA